MGAIETLKIVHLSSAHYAHDTRILHKECRSLARAGHDVTLVVPHDADTVVDGVKIRAVGNPKRPRTKLERWTRLLLQVCREAARTDADVYHFHDPELISLGWWMSVRGKRVIYDAHEDFPRTFLYKYYIPRFARKPLGWVAGKIEKFAAKWFAGVIAATPTIAEQFSGSNSNTAVVRNFPLLEEFGRRASLPWDKRPPLVAYVGSIAPERGYREAITAMSLLPARLNARLVVAGPVTQMRRKEIASLPGFERTALAGHLSRSEVAELLGRARVGLVLLYRLPNYLTALPVKLFEYMGAGIPVLASDFPILREIVDGNRCGLIVDPLDVEGIAFAIEHLLTHADEARQMGARGRMAVENSYNWGSEERRLLAFYDFLTRRQCKMERIASQAD